MIIVLLVSAMLTFGYAGSVKKSWDVYSISESWYRLCKIDKNYGYLFWLWCLLPSTTIMPLLLELLEGNKFQFLAFLMPLSLAAVGCVPKYLDEDKIPHFLYAGLSGLISVIVCFMLGQYWTPIIIVLAAIYCYWKKLKDSIYWIEIALFLSLYLAVLFSVI